MGAIRVVIFEPGKAPYGSEVKNDLASLQNIVGGYVEAVSLGRSLVLICNEEGKLLGLPPNRIVGNDVIAGTFFITKVNEKGDFVSLTDEEIYKIITNI